jgi:uncharacterized membrane protein
MKKLFYIIRNLYHPDNIALWLLTVVSILAIIGLTPWMTVPNTPPFGVFLLKITLGFLFIAVLFSLVFLINEVLIVVRDTVKSIKRYSQKYDEERNKKVQLQKYKEGKL